MSDNTSRWSSPDAPAGGARDNSEETVVSTGVDSPTETLESARSGATREMPPQIQPTGGPQPPAPPSAQTAGSSQQMPGWGVHQERSAPAAPQVVSNGAASSPWISEGSAPARARSSSQTAVRAKRGPGWAALFVTMVLTASLTLGGAWLLFNNRPSPVPVSSPASTNSTSTTVQPVTSTGDKPDWSAVSTAVSPAVVTITVSGASGSGVGSGVIYNSDGDIVTNYHVIASQASSSADGQIGVTLADGRMFEAKIVGVDQTTDLAVLRLVDAPSDLTVASFGSSAGLTVGQEVMAIGAPLGLSNTVTTGIISALNRPVEVSTRESDSHQQIDPNDPFGQLPNSQNQQTTSNSVITNAIQVDASINPGNSGGPLFDSTGAVIGINSSIASNSSSSENAGSIGLGFAIPVDLVRSVVDQLISTGRVDHAVLGVSVTSGQARVGDSVVAGAKIASVVDDSGAAQAGLRVDDVIVGVNGETVSSSKQLTGYIRRYRSGDSVTITYVRNGEKYEVVATLKSQSN
ncbi:S1C family serine protease [Actinomyces mediterranea]|uniref:S1C family serine protease n=1 Tax=Actinomyces mediterranea TaxID=1871028 RepID=UPI001F47D465|nr:trypsin-like peptidase domain-containing protein [Actinomyces mediterranea]